jgi:hypothetical protein
MESGWDPDVKRYFRKILNTISYGLIWMMSAVAAGLYFKLAIPGERPLYAVVIFYIVLVITFFFLLRYFYSTWKKN